MCVCVCACVSQLLWNVFYARFDTGVGAVPIAYLPAVGAFVASLSVMASASRYKTRMHAHTREQSHADAYR